jgi:glycolate oxidase
VAALAGAVGAEHVRSAPVDLAVSTAGTDPCCGPAGAVCLPDSTEEVRACVLAARQHGRPVVARGSGTGLAGGAVPEDGAVVISTTRR